MLRHVPAECNELHPPACLEASTERNADLYMRYGFRVTIAFPLVKNGPILWIMDPRFVSPDRPS